LLATIPYVVALLSTMAVAWHADRRKEKTLHVGVPYVVGGAVLACFGPVVRVSPSGGFVMLTAAMGFAFGGQSTMCARVAGLTPPAQAAVTLSVFNAICASLGGFAGPIVVGAILAALGSFELAAVVLGLCMGVAGTIMLCVFWGERRGATRRGKDAARDEQLGAIYP
jgi:ACS family tartrate transporter-like MFS transporter